MATICKDDKKNVGLSKCRALPQIISRFITVPKSFSVTAANALLQATWQNLLKNPKVSRGYLFPVGKQSEYIPQEATYSENQLSTSLQFQGRHRWRLSFEDGMYNHRQMASHRLSVDNIILFDQNQVALMTSLDGGANLRGMSVDLFNPEKMMFNNQTDPTRSPIYISLQAYEEIDDRGYIFKAPFLNDLNPLTDVSLRIVGTPTSTEVVVKVFYTETEDAANPENEIPILSLVLADFSLLTAAGGANGTGVTLTDNGDGTYTFDGTGFVDGTINLVAPASISVADYSIESTGAAEIDVA